MTIATGLKLNILISAAIVVIMSTVFAITFMIQKKAIHQVDFADKLSRGVYELNELSGYYIIHAEERPKVQWEIRHRSLSALLRSGSPKESQKVFFLKMERDIDEIEVLFHELVMLYEKDVPDSEKNSIDGPMLKAKREQLADLLSLRLRGISRIARIITVENTTAIEYINKETAALFSSFAVMVLMLAIWFSTRIRKSIAGPIEKLSEGTGIIRAGNLDHRIDIVEDNELGRLSDSFNQMTEYLKTTTVSRNDLIQEIARRKEAEEEIHRFNTELEVLVSERTSKLESANRELESFSYSVSHDLRTPLRAIEGFSRILEEEYRDLIDDEGKRIISIIGDNTRRMSRLIDDLLAFARVGRYEMSPTPLDMESMVKSLFNEIVPDKEAQRITFIVHSLAKSHADASLVRQVWANLLSNAVKFSSREDHPRIEVGSETREGETLYYIKDNGIGFDMAYVNKLFGVFQRLHTVDEFEGTGVGLAIAQRIINRHGGRIWAESSPGKGATFSFTLPV